MKLWLDLETYSDVPIAHGTHIYAANAEVMLLAWAIDDSPVAVLDLTAAPAWPEPLTAALADPAVEVWAHNSHFDRTVLRSALPEVCPPAERWRDTMVQALTHSLPGALGSLCEVLQVPTDKAKDKAGKQLIQLFCKPRPVNSKTRRATRETHPTEWARFVEYAALDIDAMREVHRRLPAWNYKGAELSLWHLDQRINDRGVAIDLDLVRCAIASVDTAQASLAKRTQALTEGQVESTLKRDKLLAYVLQEHGVDLPNTQMSTLERRIADPDLPPALRELLGIRLQASSTSTAKYKTLAKGTSADGRLRGTLQFAGAGRTRRWAGRLFQPQNLPRPTLEQEDIDVGIGAMKSGCADLLFDNVMQLASSAVRGTIVAPKGKKLVIADLSNIEGRDQAWLAGESWKLRAFRDFDAGTGPDLYKLAYGKSFGVRPEDVTKDQRQVGKVQELALGYEGGVGAFVTFAAAYGIDLEALAAKAIRAIPAETLGQAHIMLQWHRDQGRNPPSDFGLTDQAWLVCESFKLAWRRAHPAIAKCWEELRNAALQAVEWPGQTVPVLGAQEGLLKVRRDGNWLRIGLPSGSVMCYPSPQVLDGSLTYMGMNQYSRKWSRLKTYGGKLFENVCQSVARDVMAHNMPAIEAAGYSIVLTVHDEVITEAPDTSDYGPAHLASLLASNPPWAPDMPLAAAGFETDRYKKD